MQSFFERRGPRLDTTLPSVRHVQELIRIRTPVNVVLLSGQECDGVIRWQDSHFLAMSTEPGTPLLLISLAAIASLRALSSPAHGL
jgi:host factor-I protein